MKPSFIGLWCGAALALVLSTMLALAADLQLWNFDRDQPGTVPSGFQIGTLFDGKPAGDWQVTASDKAPSSPQVLAQLQRKGAEHAYKTVLIQGTESENIALSVKLLPIDGKADMGGGLIWRAADDRNYYLARANPLEQNIRIYRVVKGVRHVLQNFDPRCSTHPAKSSFVILFGAVSTGSSGAKISSGESSSDTSSALPGSSPGYGAN